MFSKGSMIFNTKIFTVTIIIGLSFFAVEASLDSSKKNQKRAAARKAAWERVKQVNMHASLKAEKSEVRQVEASLNSLIVQNLEEQPMTNNQKRKARKVPAFSRGGHGPYW